MAKQDPEIAAHLEWIGFVRPTGLVVSAPALVRAGAILDRRDTDGQRLLRECIQKRTFDPKEGPVPYLPDFRALAECVLGWNFSPKGYAGTPENPIPPELEVPIPNYEDMLRPDLAVRELEPKEGAPAWQLLVQIMEPGQDLDRIVSGHGLLETSPHNRMERLLRQTQIPAGLLFNGRTLRLLSAPRGESSGWLDFRVADMAETAARPISTALRLLLGQARLLSLPRAQRLATLLEDSRKFQNEVSERLAEQVLHALYELLRGFQAAQDGSKGELLRQPLAEHPDEVYRALLTVILRLVFLLYAEERDMLPEDETFLRYYSLAGLYERLREDAALFPDTMDQRFGAWAQLLVLFRMIHDGAESGSMRLPKRHGALFDPDRFMFLEGRPSDAARHLGERIDPPLVPDATIYRALEKLLVLDGERISYRALDVEQIGSVYETMMGFRLETTAGRSVAIRAEKKQGAPTAINLELLIAEPAAKRDKWIQERADKKLSDTVKKATAEAQTLEDLHAALLPIIDLAATPDLVPKGAMVLQPSEERRRSGSHYTPRALTEPIVHTTLEPILTCLRGPDGRPLRAEQILELKICDPAMGSGAFLVEACRQLGDALLEAWHTYGAVPAVPADEDEVIFARRLIAQRCLYGVDKNPVAVDLAKISLWLLTIAKDHALTFLDHALRHGDSLVGLSRRQVEALHWDPSMPILKGLRVHEAIENVSMLRRRIREADERISDSELRDLWERVLSELDQVRLFGDLVLAAFFEGQKPKERETLRKKYVSAVVGGEAEHYRGRLEVLRQSNRPLIPFHWEIEFPEVFERSNSGFDAVVGNPPFAGKNTVVAATISHYHDWLTTSHPESTATADLVAHFFRLAYSRLRKGGTFGLIATNTIREGDTRRSGLRWICTAGGAIYSAQTRYRWPGRVSVVVSVIHVAKDRSLSPILLNRRVVPKVTAFLFHAGNDTDPVELVANAKKSFQGSILLGMGFTFDDTDSTGEANPVSLMEQLIRKNPTSAEVIRPYIGGEEVNDSPSHLPHRFAIDFFDRKFEEASRWSDLMDIVRRKVKPLRDKQKRVANRERWWQYAEKRPGLYAAIANNERVLVISRVRATGFAFVSAKFIFSEQLIVFPYEMYSSFLILQSRIHECWARFFSGSALDLIRYSPTSCFETFPFPTNWDAQSALEALGKAYYEFRAALMVRNNEGLTKTYNRFHDPDEHRPEIIKLRELHSAMDRTVLDAYGWPDVQVHCEFLLDYEIDEDDWGDKKKPWRYRWPDDVRDEVLARLLELNTKRAKEEEGMGAAAMNKRSKKKPAKPSTKLVEAGDLF
jgi:hypothetical protein